jgi:hypothetical protein
MKKCTECHIEKPLNEFHKLKNGVRSQCKLCRKIKTSEYRKKNKFILNKKQKIYYENNKETRYEYTKSWVADNKDKVKKYTKTYNIKNKEYKQNYNKIYRIKNKTKVKEWDINRRLKYPHISAWRRILNNSLVRLKKEKTTHTIDLLGYSALELKNHLESLFTEGMSWDNYGEWHIDHIKPVSSFDKDTPMSIVNALSNLQPLWATTREINGVIYEGNLNKWARE